MKKTLIFQLTAAVVLFGVALAVFQFYKNKNIHEYVQPVAATKAASETMSAKGKGAKGEPLNLYVYHDETELSKQLFHNLTYALDYAKVPFKAITAKEISNLTPSPYTVLVLTGENAEAWPYETVRSFVEKGGRLVVTSRFNDPKWNELVGIETEQGFVPDTVYGLKMERSFFPGYPDLSGGSELIQGSILDVTLRKEAELYMTAEDMPILWTYPYQKGKVVYWNTTMLGAKNLRGMLLQSIGLASPAFVSSQVAAKVVFIDDFPSPVPSGKSDSITRDYHLSIADFYEEVWWEDMKRWGEQYDVVYTGAFIGTYRNDMELESADLIKNARERMTLYGRVLLESKGEVGFHGYNHQSLVTKEEPLDPELGYRPWKDQAQMEESLKRAKAFFEHYYPNETFETYVPPSNILNQTGLAAIHHALPNIKTIASLYTGNPETGSYIQEFAFDQTYKGLYHFPRITSNYMVEGDEHFIMNDAIANFGIVSHFVHPDDILDPDRAAKGGWPQMRSDFERALKRLDDTFPYLEELTVQEAREKIIKYQEGTIRVSYTEEAIYIEGTNILNPSICMIRVEEGKALETGSFQFGEVKAFDQAAGLYTVKLTEPTAKLVLKEKKK